MKTFEEFKHYPELYGSEQIIQEDVLLYPAYVEYVKKATAKEIVDHIREYIRYTFFFSEEAETRLEIVADYIEEKYGVVEIE